MPGEAYHRNICVFEQANDGWCHSCLVQPEKETDVFCRYLKQGNLVVIAFAERRSRLCVDTKNGLREQAFSVSPADVMTTMRPWNDATGKSVISCLLNLL